MRARAEAAEETRRRIIDAAIDLYYDGRGPDSTLQDVAERASVSVQTVLRHFGTRAALDEAAAAEARQRVEEERRATPGDADAAVRALFDHYERLGRRVIVLLARESLGGGPGLSGGRQAHREWVEAAFAPQLAELPTGRRQELVDQLVVATDVYTWKLLRLDAGLDRGSAERRVRDMAAALLRCRREG